MIATLNGVVSEKLADRVVIDVNGVGYGVLVSSEDYDRLEIDQPTKLYIFEYIREQAHDLFGFTLKDDQDLFEQLLNVSGVGPKMALNVLSLGSAEDVRQAIAAGDAAYVQRANNVGKKVAERIVVDLKDKVGLVGADLDLSNLGGSTKIKDEAVQALVSLGYSSSDALRALKDVDPNLPTEDRVKEALQGGLK